jgi:hypothetical protein
MRFVEIRKGSSREISSREMGTFGSNIGRADSDYYRYEIDGMSLVL